MKLIIRPLQQSDLDDVVDIHLACLPSTTTSRIGRNYVRLLYAHLLDLPIHQSLVAETENHQIVGVITTTQQLSVTSRYLSQASLPWSAIYVLQALIRRSVSLPDILQKIRFEQNLLQRFGNPYPSILTICVVPVMQHQGVGRKLVHEIIKHYRKHNMSDLYVDTEWTNTLAQRFYSSQNAKPVATIGQSLVFHFSL